ncbi:hypothetical protein G6M50_38205 [Agrobacterium rhizogenes]|nr:hypothetical protein [Rhizobium rhizogenes]NTJ83621.1 hypothetical protein [Rhizobium rhizogenes]
MTEKQLDLLDWRAPAEVIPFPMARSHGLTAGIAKQIMHLDKPTRTGKLNSIRARTRKQMEPLFGAVRAEKIADDLVTRIKIQIRFREIDRGSIRPDKA